MRDIIANISGEILMYIVRNVLIFPPIFSTIKHVQPYGKEGVNGMGVPRSVNYDRVLEVYEETGQIRKTARIMGIHDNTVRTIIKSSKSLCRRCGKFTNNGKRMCDPCAALTQAEAKALKEAHLRQGLCAKCDEPLSPPSRYHCAKHKAESVEATRAYRRKRIVNIMGTTLEAEKLFRVEQDYGKGGVEAWQRDKGCCVLCDVSYADRMVFIHHLDRNRKNNTAGNLVCLCYTCHRLVHGLSEHPHLLRFLHWFHTHYPATALPQTAQALLPRHARAGAKRSTPVDEPSLTFDFVGT
jgi:hypothetical protein